MTENTVRRMMRRDVKKFGSMRNLAKEMKVTVAYVSDILAHKRHIGPSIAKYYGLTIERCFVVNFKVTK